MDFSSWVGALFLGGALCTIMWGYGKFRYSQGWQDGFRENLELRLAEIKDGLASRIEVYHVTEEKDEDEE